MDVDDDPVKCTGIYILYYVILFSDWSRVVIHQVTTASRSVGFYSIDVVFTRHTGETYAIKTYFSCKGPFCVVTDFLTNTWFFLALMKDPLLIYFQTTISSYFCKSIVIEGKKNPKYIFFPPCNTSRQMHNSSITTTYSSKNSRSFLENLFNFKASHTLVDLEGLFLKCKRKNFDESNQQFQPSSSVSSLFSSYSSSIESSRVLRISTSVFLLPSCTISTPED
ncbi:hypothetical protein QTP88_026504 [Uroleucon formosanum]